MKTEINVLIVDDKEENLLALEMILEEEPLNIIKATNGNDALKLSLKHEFALAILDVQMPIMNGYELAELMRGQAEMKNLPIIFVSAVYSDQSHIFKGYDSGAVDFITKPYNAKILVSKVRVFVEIYRQQKALEQDIVIRKKFEKELKVLHERLNKAQAIANLGNWEWQITTGDLWWSDEIYRIFGLNQEEFAATYEGFLNCVHPEDREMVSTAVANTLNDHKPYNVDHRVVRPDGSERIVNEQGKVLVDDKGEPYVMQGIVHDITERKLIETELKELNAHLEERVREEVEKSRQKDFAMMHQARLAAMGEMIGHIAHQWRQPLNALNLTLANIKDDYEYKELTEESLAGYVNHGYELIQKMSATIDDFRNFFNPKRKQEEFLPSEVITKTFELVGNTYKNHNINVVIEETCGSKITGYANEYSQVVLNLLNNAKDALLSSNTKNAEIRVKVHCEKDKNIVTITDNAGGVPDDIIGTIFEPYITTKEETGGTGIGLYMSKTIIEEHMGGELVVRNVKDGAEFRIVIPVSAKGKG